MEEFLIARMADEMNLGGGARAHEHVKDFSATAAHHLSPERG